MDQNCLVMWSHISEIIYLLFLLQFSDYSFFMPDFIFFYNYQYEAH